MLNQSRLADKATTDTPHSTSYPSPEEYGVPAVFEYAKSGFYGCPDHQYGIGELNGGALIPVRARALRTGHSA